MSHCLQTHYHITATPANREAAPRIQVELHQRSLIQQPQATRSNKPCLHCMLAGWRGDGAFQKGMCAGAEICTHKCTCCCYTYTLKHPAKHTHTNIAIHAAARGKEKKTKKRTRLHNPQKPPKHSICADQLLKLSRCTLSHKSELVLRSGVTDWA